MPYRSIQAVYLLGNNYMLTTPESVHCNYSSMLIASYLCSKVIQVAEEIWQPPHRLLTYVKYHPKHQNLPIFL